MHSSQPWEFGCQSTDDYYVIRTLWYHKEILFTSSSSAACFYGISKELPNMGSNMASNAFLNSVLE